MGKLNEKRIRHKYDSYLYEWSFLVDENGDLWVKSEDLMTTQGVYDGCANTIHVYGDDEWLCADLSMFFNTWVKTKFDYNVYQGYLILDQVIDE